MQDKIKNIIIKNYFQNTEASIPIEEYDITYKNPTSHSWKFFLIHPITGEEIQTRSIKRSELAELLNIEKGPKCRNYIHQALATSGIMSYFTYKLRSDFTVLQEHSTELLDSITLRTGLPICPNSMYKCAIHPKNGIVLIDGDGVKHLLSYMQFLRQFLQTCSAIDIPEVKQAANLFTKIHAIIYQDTKIAINCRQLYFDFIALCGLEEVVDND